MQWTSTLVGTSLDLETCWREFVRLYVYLALSVSMGMAPGRQALRCTQADYTP